MDRHVQQTNDRLLCIKQVSALLLLQKNQDESTDYVQKESGNLRICLDPRDLKLGSGPFCPGFTSKNSFSNPWLWMDIQRCQLRTETSCVRSTFGLKKKQWINDRALILRSAGCGCLVRSCAALVGSVSTELKVQEPQNDVQKAHVDVLKPYLSR